MNESTTKQKCFMKIIEKYNVQLISIKNTSNSPINERIDQIYVINLKSDVIKRNYIITLFKKYEINFTLLVVDYIPINTYNKICGDGQISRSELGCCVSHLWCLKHIISSNYKNAIIFEDDIILHKEFISKFIKIFDSNKFVDFLLLGSHDYMFTSTHHNNIKKGLYKPSNEFKNLYGAHANYYSLNAAKRQFLIRTSQIAFFDKEYSLMFNHFPKSYICYPNLVVANITTSNLNHKKEILSELELEYYKKCFINFNFEKYNFLYLNLLTNINLNNFNKNTSYVNFTEKYLYQYFYDFDKIEKIQKRLVMNFFTIEDIKNIIHNTHTNETIEPIREITEINNP
jgi:GR25 family glycosyltransferase involved in LPS biosynthesis